MKKGIVLGGVPGDSVAAKLRLARAAGFDGVEIGTLEDPAQRTEYRMLAEEIGLELPSVMASGHWKYPLSSTDETVRQEGLANIRASVDTAKAVGASTVLVVPGVVSADQPYAEAYEISLQSMRELASYAEEQGVMLAVENVWNKFLLSPREMCQFLTEIGSETVGLYFDCGNIMAYGFPQQWIRELANWIMKVHVKGFDTNTRQFTQLLAGNVPWGEIRTALQDIGYDDYLSAEVGMYTTYKEQTVYDIAGQIDRIIAGE